MEKDVIYYIWLSLICGPASPVAADLVSSFGGAHGVYSADDEELWSIENIPDKIKRGLCNKDLDDAKTIIDFCLGNNVGIITINDKRYPSRLKRIQAPPILLYYRGVLPDFDNTVCIAMVGTRDASESGNRIAHDISRDLSLAGVVVVSGMAYGIDSAAAWGAIDAGGHTVAVFGCGIDVTYPQKHELLMNRIIVGGVVLTEYPPHTEPKGYNFPQRNRIISGLCQGTVVVEAPIDSGAMITASRAQEQGRDIFAVPGNVTSRGSQGPHALIKDGAHMVTCAEDIIMEYVAAYPFTLDINRMKRLRREAYNSGPYYEEQKVAAPARPKNFYADDKLKNNGKNSEKEKNAKKPPMSKSKPVKTDDLDEDKIKAKLESLDERDRKIYGMFPDGVAITSDSLCNAENSASDVLTSLTMLEIEGLIEALPGGLYKKK